jgi:hypothetical protein
MGAATDPSEHEEVIQAHLKSTVAHQGEAACGEQPDRVRRLETIVLVLGHAIKDSQSLTEVNEPVNLRRRHRADDPPARSQECSTGDSQGALRARRDVLEHREHRDGVVPFALGQCIRRVPLNESE